MPSASTGTVKQLHSSDVLEAQMIGNPIEDARQKFRDNIHRANRIAKKELARVVKRNLSSGIGGRYHPRYAERKNRDPRAVGGPYSSGGPVDLKFSGRLHDNIVGRGRAKPSELVLQVWVGLKSRNKRRPKSAPGTFSNYGSLMNHLKRTKIRDDTFEITEREKENIMRKTVRQIFKGD